jgi:membrane-bound ClpP family serine protease
MQILDILSNMTTLSIILFIAGVALLIIEMFHPGFGFAGILGIIALIADIFVTAKTLAQGLLLAAIVAVIILILLLIGARFVSKGKFPKPLVLKDATDGISGISGKESYLGKTGTAETTLRPAGIADFDGLRLDVVSQGGFISKGEKVEVVEADGNRLVVKEVK